jgi:DNA-binding LytR/AlgR family response regulator
VLLDIWMPDTDGISLLKEWGASGLRSMPVVMMSGHGTIDTAVEATKLGAADFLEKPVALAKLIDTVSKAINRGMVMPRRAPSMDLSALGKSQLILELKKRLTQIAGNTAPVMLLGEPGCGFEICAQFLHQPGTPWVEVKDRARLVTDPLSLVEPLGSGTLYLPTSASSPASSRRASRCCSTASSTPARGWCAPPAAASRAWRRPASSTAASTTASA